MPTTTATPTTATTPTTKETTHLTTTHLTTTPTMATYLPPPSIPPQLPSYLPSELTSPTSLRFPTTWRCGTCTTLHPILSLMTSLTAHCACSIPALQAVYDQFGAIYLFWRDDPAVADLSVPRMAEEARWRVWRAGGDGWGFVAGLEDGWEDVGGMGVVIGRTARALSQSSAASDESEGSRRAGYAMEA